MGNLVMQGQLPPPKGPGCMQWIFWAGAAWLIVNIIT